MAEAELRSLVLAGGASARMGVDKALLSYHGGEPQARYLARQLAVVTVEACVSVRREQLADKRYEGLRLLADRDADIGPLAGLLSAFAHAPRAAWLVAAVDMPNVTIDTLRRLIAARDPSAYATAYRNPETGRAEPVLAIYEPAILPALQEARASGNYSLKLLSGLPVCLVETKDPKELLNVNEPEEYRRIQEVTHGPGRES